MREVEANLVPPCSGSVLDLAALSETGRIDAEEDSRAGGLDRVDVLHEVRVLGLGDLEGVVRGGQEEVGRYSRRVEKE